MLPATPFRVWAARSASARRSSASAARISPGTSRLPGNEAAEDPDVGLALPRTRLRPSPASRPGTDASGSSAARPEPRRALAAGGAGAEPPPGWRGAARLPRTAPGASAAVPRRAESGSIGFVTWSFIPASRQRSRSPHGVGRHRHDREASGARAARGSARRLEAVHHRHLQVHEHEVVRPRPSRARSATSPFPATSTWIPAAPSISIATCWLIRLSSTRRTLRPAAAELGGRLRGRGGVAGPSTSAPRAPDRGVEQQRRAHRLYEHALDARRPRPRGIPPPARSAVTRTHARVCAERHRGDAPRGSMPSIPGICQSRKTIRRRSPAASAVDGGERLLADDGLVHPERMLRSISASICSASGLSSTASSAARAGRAPEVALRVGSARARAGR